MWLLFASCVALLVGPALAHLSGERKGPLAMLDGFVVVALVGLLALDVLPDALVHGGPPALAAVAVGVALPRILEGRLHLHGKGLHGAMIWGAVLGYGLHAVFDGAALVDGAHHAHDAHGHDHGGSLGLSVVLHRVPVGVSLYWLVKPSYGRRGGAIMIALITLATSLGYFGARPLVPLLPVAYISVFQALVAGTLMHVVLHSGESLTPGTSLPRWSAAGAGVAALLLGLHEPHPLISGEGRASGVVPLFASLAVTLAPFALASLVVSFVALRVAGGLTGRASGVAAALRSCGCHLAGLLAHAAARDGSARSFAAITGVVAFASLAGGLLLVPLAGPLAALVWLAGALTVVLLAGAVGARFGGPRLGGAAGPPAAHGHANREHANREHANREHANREHATREHASREHASREHASREHASREVSESPALAAGARSVSLIAARGEHLAVELAMGMFFAAFLGALPLGAVFAPARAWHPALGAMVGVATYFGSPAIVPIALVAVSLGFSPGGALALILVAPLPAGTLVTALDKAGRRQLGVWLTIGWAAAAAASGYLVDATAPQSSLGAPWAAQFRAALAGALSVGALHAAPLGLACAVPLAAVFLVAFVRRGPRELFAHMLQGDQHEHA